MLSTLFHTALLVALHLPTLSTAQCSIFTPILRANRTNQPGVHQTRRPHKRRHHDAQTCNNTAGSVPCWVGNSSVWASTPPTNMTTTNAHVGGLIAVSRSTRAQPNGAYSSDVLYLSSIDSNYTAWLTELQRHVTDDTRFVLNMTTNITGYGFTVGARGPGGSLGISGQAEFKPTYKCMNGAYPSGYVFEFYTPVEVQTAPYCAKTPGSTCINRTLDGDAGAGAPCWECRQAAARAATGGGSSLKAAQLGLVVALCGSLGMLVL